MNRISVFLTFSYEKILSMLKKNLYFFSNEKSRDLKIKNKLF